MPEVACHPGRKHYAKGLCESCWRKTRPSRRDQQRIAERRYRATHPDRVKASGAKWRANNQEYRNRNRRECQDAVVARVADIKLAAGCMDCGYNAHAEALDFDHRPDEVKLGNISRMVHSAAWSVILDEIAKCDVVCANCHRVRSAVRRGAHA